MRHSTEQDRSCGTCPKTTHIEPRNATIAAWHKLKAGPGVAKMPKVIDINSAPVRWLQRLSGIGVFYAKKIVSGRPYSATEELQHILPLFVYNRMKHQIMVEHRE